jgi:hypothetical protein
MFSVLARNISTALNNSQRANTTPVVIAAIKTILKDNRRRVKRDVAHTLWQTGYRQAQTHNNETMFLVT